MSVSAWPAVKLLWGSADSVTVRASSLSISPAQTAKLLSEAGDVNSLTLTAASVREGPLAAQSASLRKPTGRARRPGDDERSCGEGGAAGRACGCGCCPAKAGR